MATTNSDKSATDRAEPKKLDASGKVITAYSYPLSRQAQAAIARAFQQRLTRK
ncbi:MAG: hypothetical protein ACRCT8_16990 [Lacipirellulaceae bacterium]